MSSRRDAACLEVTPEQAVASALDWPGWCRAGRDEGAALAALAGYAGRYAPVAGQARASFPATVAVEVAGRVPGGPATVFVARNGADTAYARKPGIKPGQTARSSSPTTGTRCAPTSATPLPARPGQRPQPQRRALARRACLPAGRRGYLVLTATSRSDRVRSTARPFPWPSPRARLGSQSAGPGVVVGYEGSQTVAPAGPVGV
jgi:hypothetical protein